MRKGKHEWARMATAVLLSLSMAGGGLPSAALAEMLDGQEDTIALEDADGASGEETEEEEELGAPLTDEDAITSVESDGDMPADDGTVAYASAVADGIEDETLSTPAESPYRLWVGGTPVTAENANDIPAASPATSTGKASYNDGNHTLTLTDYRCEGLSGGSGLLGVIYYAGRSPLTVTLAGDSTISAGGGSVTHGIYSVAPLTINGGGSLTAVGADGAYESSCGVCFAYSLTIQGCTVNATGGNTEAFEGDDAVSCGLLGTSSNIWIENATVGALGGNTNQESGSLSAGIKSDCVTISDATVKAFGAKGSASYGIRTILGQEYSAAGYDREGLAEQEQIVQAYLEIEKAQRESIAVSSKVLTTSNYYNAACARGLVQEMIKYKLLQDGLVNSENLRNIKMEWTDSNYDSKYVLVQYLDRDKVYHEEYYDYVTCDSDGQSLFR